MGEHTVWKYTLRVADVQTVEAPIGGTFIHAAEQHGSICVWYRCDPSQPKAYHQIAIVGTGHSAPVDAYHVGSILMHGGALVLHVFARQVPA